MTLNKSFFYRSRIRRKLQKRDISERISVKGQLIIRPGSVSGEAEIRAPANLVVGNIIGAENEGLIDGLSASIKSASVDGQLVLPNVIESLNPLANTEVQIRGSAQLSVTTDREEIPLLGTVTGTIELDGEQLARISKAVVGAESLSITGAALNNIQIVGRPVPVIQVK